MFGLAAMAGIASCEFGKITVDKPEPQVVVHSVLNPNALNQVVYVEQTLTGTITVPDSGFSPTDPILSGGGVPISDAIVEIIDPNGKVYPAIEDRTVPANNGKGAGVYRAALSGNQLVLGGRYKLHVRTTTGDVTGTTQIPNATVRALGALTQTLNRDHDTLNVRWTASPGARSYAIRIESPFGPFFFFTDSTHFRVTGDLRNPFANNLERVFIPGFRQTVVVGAVDSNFYDYYRTGNDPFTGSGLINRLSGGIGIFGSIVEVSTGVVSVVADQTEPIEGRFRLATGTLTTNGYAQQLTLYVESKAARDNLPDALSGRYTTPNPNSRSDGIIGERTGDGFTLALLGSQLLGDTLEVFEGFISGDSLIGRYRLKGGTAVFLRTP